MALLGGVSAALLVGCGSASSPASSPGSMRQAGSSPARSPVTVFAAASLKDAFTQIAADHPELDVTVNYDGSNGLVDQLAGGARADVFASADTASMDKARAAGMIAGDPALFASNVLVLVVPAGNPAEITGLDSSLAGRKLVVCAPAVPCGKATQALASAAGVVLRPVSEETKVTDVRGKVESGEADAGLVYATDARAAGDAVAVVPVPAADKVVNRYPIALVAGAPQPEGGRAFIAAVRSSQGQEVLSRHGFGAP